MPPARNKGEVMEAKIVSKLGNEFNVHEVYGTESSYICSLKSVNELNPVEIPPREPVALDESMLEVCIVFPQCARCYAHIYINKQMS